MNGTPIIKIEVDTLKIAMHQAFKQELVRIDEQFKRAIDSATHADRVQQILDDAAGKFLKQALEEETKQYFLYGEGRKHIAKKVKERLKNYT
jgi:hypothetical protein